MVFLAVPAAHGFMVQVDPRLFVHRGEAGPEDKQDAGATLGEILLEMKVSGKLTATDVRLIAYWAAKAGACGIEDMGMAPGARTGNYSRHLDLSRAQREIDGGPVLHRRACPSAV